MESNAFLSGVLNRAQKKFVENEFGWLQENSKKILIEGLAKIVDEKLVPKKIFDDLAKLSEAVVNGSSFGWDGDC